MKKRKDISAFGIGCFFFIPRRKPPFKLSTKEFVNDIKSFLSSIPTVSDINISDNDSDELIEIISPIEDFSEDPFSPPFVSYLDISFQVYIPFRVQEELMKELTPPKNYSEYFRVYINHGYNMPVTFVELIAPSEPPDPSDAIVVVREYLKKHAPKENTFVKFESLGPSPFHANFYLFPSNKKTKPKEIFTAVRIERRGYDEVGVSYDKTCFKSHQEAKELFIFEAARELYLYYSIQLNELKELRLWLNIEEELNNVIEDKTTTFVEKIFHALKRGTTIKKLQSHIAELESQKVFGECSVKQEYRETYVKHEIKLFQSFIDEAFKEQQQYPIKPIMELSSFLEQRRGRTLEMFIVFISAILGGLVGAAITLYFY